MAAAIDPRNLMVLPTTGGFVYSLAIAFALIYLWRCREDRRLVVFALLWAVPVVVFWGLRDGNSARHLMSAFVPMALVLALLVQRLFSRHGVRFAAAAVLLLGNYALAAPSAGMVRPSTRLIDSSRLLQEKVSRLHRDAAAIASLDDAKVFLVGSWANPYVVFAMLAKARTVRHGDELMLTLADGQTQRFARAYVLDVDDARRLAAQKRAQGYRVVSLNYDDAELAP
jgi:4-amino-4-deoxy-L-arabinose transferase-like glycosyltransferase